MERRNFITTAALAAASVGLGSFAKAKEPSADQEFEKDIADDIRYWEGLPKAHIVNFWRRGLILFSVDGEVLVDSGLFLGRSLFHSEVSDGGRLIIEDFLTATQSFPFHKGKMRAWRENDKGKIVETWGIVDYQIFDSKPVMESLLQFEEWLKTTCGKDFNDLNTKSKNSLILNWIKPKNPILKAFSLTDVGLMNLK